MNVIPQIFYDLIARVIPATGILFFISLTTWFFDEKNGDSLISFLGSDQFNISHYLNLWIILLFAVLSYILSLVLKLPSEWLSELKILRKVFFIKEQTTDSERYQKEIFFFKNQSKNIPEPWKMFSIVRVKLPEEGYRLLKMLAEIRLCEMLFFGFFLLAIVNIILLFFSKNNPLCGISLIMFFFISSRSLLQLKYSIKNSYEKGVFMTWKQLEEEKTSTNIDL